MDCQDIIGLQEVSILSDISVLEGYGFTVRVVVSRSGIPCWSSGRAVRGGDFCAVQICDEPVIIFHAQGESG